MKFFFDQFCEPACQPIKDTNDKLEKESSSIMLIVIISVTIVIFLTSMIIIYYCYVKRNQQEKGDKDMLLEGNITLLNSCMILNKQAAHLSYNGKNEIERSKFEIGRKLGGGNFGSIHEGMTEDPSHPGKKTKVAIKSVNNPLDSAQIYSLICEIKILDQLEKCLDLVNVIGACTTQFRIGKIWLLLEYCPHGDMKSFLLKKQRCH